MAGHGHIRVKATRHEYSITIAYHGNQFRIFGVVIDKLDAECRFGHVEEYVNFFQHLRVFVGGQLVQLPGSESVNPATNLPASIFFASSKCRLDPGPPVLKFSSGFFSMSA